MANPAYQEGAVTMFYAGDDAEAKQIAAKLATDCGFEAVDVGPLKHARLLEPLAMLWIYLAYGAGMGPDVAFRLMRSLARRPTRRSIRRFRDGGYQPPPKALPLLYSGGSNRLMAKSP